MDDAADCEERAEIDRLMLLREANVAGLEAQLTQMLRDRIWRLTQETGLRAPELPASESDEVRGLARVCETLEWAREHIRAEGKPPSPWPPAELCPASPARSI